jgi:hypothetical protein
MMICTVSATKVCKSILLCSQKKAKRLYADRQLDALILPYPPLRASHDGTSSEMAVLSMQTVNSSILRAAIVVC